MPLYDYWCECGAHTIDVFASMADHADTVRCELHDADCPRSFRSQRANTNDPFRSYHLSGKGVKAAEKQGRPVQGPRDKQEARDMGQALGRIYIGDDYDKLSEKGQRAVSKTFAHNEKGAS